MTPFIDSYAQTPDGLLFVADGFSVVRRWDGLAADFVDAGVIKPATAMTLAGGGLGAILGDYYGYQRFVDDRGNFSDFSPISAKLAAQGNTGSVSAASNASPVEITTSAAHGLSTGHKVKVENVRGNLGANGTWTITVTAANKFTLDGSVGTGAYTSGGTWKSGVAQINYTSVPVPTEAKVVKRQILRNTAGQATTFYVDVETADLVGTSFSSTKDDTALAAGTAVPLTDVDGEPVANQYGIPPSHKAVLAHHLGRMFLAVERDYREGNVQVTNGSATVRGLNTRWTAKMAGRRLYVVGAAKDFEISSVDTAAQTLTLATAYTGATDLYAPYAIRPAPAERRLIYYSQGGLPEAWPATNAISLQEDGDELTGLMPLGSFLYVLEKRHVYRFTFQSNPGIDGFVYLSCTRGCVNNRCWVVVEEQAYLLDQAGIYRFAAGEVEPTSNPIQQLFRAQDLARHINWRAAEHFHAAHDPSEQVIRWFVALAGQEYPRHAVCLDYRGGRWWLEEYAVRLGASCTGNLDGHRRVFLGAEARRVLLPGAGTLDGPDPAAGTVRGNVSSAGLATLTDGSATFAASGLVNAPVAVVSGRGKGQRRVVRKVDGQKLRFDEPWLERPDSTSVYQLGAVSWAWQTKWFRYAEDDEQTPRRVAVVYQPVASAAALDVRVFQDYGPSPVEWALTRAAAENEGFASTKDKPDLVADLTNDNAHAQQRLDSQREAHTDGPRFVSVRLAGVQNRDLVKVYEVTLDGAVD